MIIDKFLNENKLTAAERKKLKNSDFGIPQERKFPLIDKNHINMAIKYFYTVDIKYSTLLANNINKKAKELGIKVNVTKDNPFYKYADKTIINDDK